MKTCARACCACISCKLRYNIRKGNKRGTEKENRYVSKGFTCNSVRLLFHPVPVRCRPDHGVDFSRCFLTSADSELQSPKGGTANEQQRISTGTARMGCPGNGHHRSDCGDPYLTIATISAAKAITMAAHSLISLIAFAVR